MASNRFRYPPAPGHGGDTFSDNLVGNQITDGSSQMTLGNFSIEQDYSQTIATPSVIRAFSKPITLESLDFTNLETAKEQSINTILNLNYLSHPYSLVQVIGKNLKTYQQIF